MDWEQCRKQIKHLLYELALTGRISKDLFVVLLYAINNVEPVVRCKDCRYNYANMIPGGKGCQQNVYIEMPGSWYCADGERMGEVENNG